MASAARRVWEKSRAKNGALLVLMAIAFECEKGDEVEMSVAELARKARLGERTARAGVRELEGLGEISVAPAKGGRSRYALAPDPGRYCRGTPADSAAPANIAAPPTPAISAGVKTGTSQVSTATPADIAGVGIPDALSSSLVSDTGEKPKASEIPREDVDRLCRHLADRIAANGSRRPVITRRWRDSARLLIDKDGRTEEQVHAAIDWSQDHHFWHRNILSMEKLRQQYDRLRLDAKAEREEKARPAASGHQPTPEEFDALRENWARPFDEKEAGNDPRGNDRPGAVHRGHLPAAED